MKQTGPSQHNSFPKLIAVGILGTLLSGVGACADHPTLPFPGEEQGFLAILLNYTSLAGVSPGQDYSVRVREVSGTLEIDRTATAAPGDTVVMSLPVATYRVDLEGVPESCSN
ncbi:MAG: hypothetical protein GEU90_22955, partial [Gemmatimonas sp.]|nr:hypothetical protein [Gemmatimonas sp.]